MTTKILAAGFLLLTCVGCNIGNAPQPMSDDELQSALDKLPPQDQINYINSSPMPPDMKAKRIKEIEEKTGYKAPKKEEAPFPEG
jgi:hypothetical protein